MSQPGSGGPNKTLGQIMVELNYPFPDAPEIPESSVAAPEIYPPTNDELLITNPDGASAPPSIAESDLSPTARQILSRYATSEIENKNTNYPDKNPADNVQAIVGNPVPTTTSGEEGMVYATIMTAEAVADAADTESEADAETKALTTNAMQLDTTKLGNLLDKTGGNTLKRGSRVLRKIEAAREAAGVTQGAPHGSKLDASAGTVAAGSVAEMVQEMLETYNRYHPGGSSPFVTQGGKDGEKNLGGGSGDLYTLQGDNWGVFDKDAKAISVTDLRKAALETLFRAQSVSAGDASKAAEGIHEGNHPFAEGAAALMGTPHGTQTGPNFLTPGQAWTVPIDAMRIRHTAAVSKFAISRGADDILTLQSFTRGEGSEKSSPTKSTGVNSASSYGTMTSPSEPFGGMTPWGMVLPLIINILIFAIIGIVFSLLIGLIVGPKADMSGGREPENPSSFAFGSNAPKPGGGMQIVQELLRMFGIPRFGGMNLMSTFMGLLLFFGIDFSKTPVGPAIFDSLANIIFTPGYYLTVTKRALADFNQFNVAFAAIGGAAGIGKLSAILEAFMALFDSFLTKFLFMCAHLGSIYTASRKFPGAVAHGVEIIPLHQQDKQQVLTALNRNMMSRFHTPGQTARSTLSLHLFNSALYAGPHSPAIEGTASRVVGMTDALYDEAPGAITAGVSTVPQRMSPAQLDQIETSIDAEYMPFSIQDVRTNEIISMPAFIQSINDDFNVEYSTTHGYGRTDPVYAYAKTSRQINMSFVLVAMNEIDHNYMWYIINKFVSMCYPQRDSGIKRYFSDGKPFVQPFSQVIAASPLIRLRLGDVIASNSSGRAMERIFGGSETLQSLPDLDPEQSKQWANAMQMKKSLRSLAKGYIKSDLDKAWKGGAHQTDNAGQPDDSKFKGQEVIIAKGTSVLIAVPADNMSLPVPLPPTAAMSLIPVKLNFPVKATIIESSKIGGREREIEGETVTVPVWGWTIEIADIADEREAMALGGAPFLAYFRAIENVGGFPSLPPPPKINVYLSGKNTPLWSKTTFMDDAAVDTYIGSPEFTAKSYTMDTGNEVSGAQEDVVTLTTPAQDLTTAQAAIDDLGGEGRSFDEIVDFLSDNNAVVKAFKSSGGRGLAGFFTQMGLDYGSALWGTSFEDGFAEKGLRAPKSVTVNISFAPVHDFPLGLDEFGQMFAPSHPVGTQSHEQLNDWEAYDDKMTRLKDAAVRAVTILPEFPSAS